MSYFQSPPFHFSLESPLLTHISYCSYYNIITAFVSLLPASAVSSSVIQMLIFTCSPPSFVIMCLPILLSSSCFLVTPPFQFFHLPYSDLFLSFFLHSLIHVCLFLSSAFLSLAVPQLSNLLVYLCVCVCTDNSLVGSIHRYLRPLRAPLFILSRSSSTAAQEEG